MRSSGAVEGIDGGKKILKKFYVGLLYLRPFLRPFLMALTDLDFRHKFVIDNPEISPYGPMFTNFGFL